MDTSHHIRTRLIELADLEYNDMVLEPSAGAGFIVNAIEEKVALQNIWMVELNESNHIWLTQKFSGYIPKSQIIHGDYLKEYINLPSFDKIIAVPPYMDNVDCRHISCMFANLKPGGRLLSLTYPGWVTGNFSIQSNFRKFLSGKDYRMEFIEDDSSYMNVPKVILTIYKPHF